MPQPLRPLDPGASALAYFGARLREYRTRRGWPQAELGRRVHVSGTLIAKMERAERRPQPAVAHSLDLLLEAGGELDRLAAEALRCPLPPPPVKVGEAPGELSSSSIGSDPVGPGSRVPPAGWARGIDELRRLADAYDLPDDGSVRPVAELDRVVAGLVRARLDSDYEALLQVLPELIPELTRALVGDRGGRREHVARHLVQAWRAAEALAVKLELADLAARLTHVMGWAAAQTADGLALAATSYVRAETFFVTDQARAGHAMLERAADRVDAGASVPACAQYGSLHMRAAIAAARAGLDDEANGHISEAREMASRVAEGVWEGTAFGPDSVRIHEVSTAVELGASRAALAVAANWTPPATMPAERRSHYFVDLARAQLRLLNADGVLEALERARRAAPQNVRVDAQVLRTLTDLAREQPSAAAAVNGFARSADITRRRGYRPPGRLRLVRAGRAAPAGT